MRGLSIKMSSYQSRHSHYTDKRSHDRSIFITGITITWKTVFLLKRGPTPLRRNRSVEGCVRCCNQPPVFTLITSTITAVSQAISCSDISSPLFTLATKGLGVDEIVFVLLNCTTQPISQPAKIRVCTGFRGRTVCRDAHVSSLGYYRLPFPIHDDVIKWNFSPRHWPFVRGIHRSPVDSPPNGQWRGALIFSMICAWANRWANNRDTGDLRRHRAHHDVTVMTGCICWYLCYKLSRN